jgi:SAM-dependent methyltransferase
VSAIAFRNSIEQIRRRYQRLAPIYPFFELVFLLPRGIPRRAVHRLGLVSGDSLLEVGCGTGRNLRHLVEAVGENGRVYALDCCEQMLRKVGKLDQRSGWKNVALLNQDAALLELPGMVDGVLFSLSYSVMPEPRAALEAAWKYLQPGKSLVIMRQAGDGDLRLALATVGDLAQQENGFGRPDEVAVRRPAQIRRQGRNRGVQFRYVLHLQGNKEQLRSCQRRAELKVNRNPGGRLEFQEKIEPILPGGFGRTSLKPLKRH